MMSVRAKFVAAVVGASTAFLLSLPSPAAAEDPLGGVVDQTVDAIDSTVSDTTQVVDSTVSDTTQVVGETVDTVSEVASDPTTADTAVGDVVADSTTSVSDTVNAVGDAAGDASVQTDSSAGSAYSTGGGSGDSTAGTGDNSAGSLDGDRQRDGGKGQRDRSRAHEIGDREWIWETADRLESTWENVPVGLRIEQVAVSGESDPCRDDPALVCLGILYEMGRYAKIVTSVLGALATTGIGVVGLMAMALALGTTGSAALVASRRRPAAAAGRG